MTLHLSHDFDGIVFTPSSPVRTGEIYAGPKKLLAWLETHLGRAGYPENTDYLRIELFRQSLQQHRDLDKQAAVFYEQSFESDRFATAAALLAWRDELLLAGWDFSASRADTPDRLRTLASVEATFSKKINDPALGPLAFGFADRFVAALEAAEKRDLPLREIFLYEPAALQIPVVQRFLKVFQEKNVRITEVPAECKAAAGTHLGRLQRSLAGSSTTVNTDIETPISHLTSHFSLLILKARRDSDAATFLAQLLAKNPSFRPLLLLPEMNRVLEQSLELEGFPALGVLSASLARPSLQVLKLAPAFLWEPVDVFKIMEFVTLPLKPLDSGLALEIARVLADRPGLYSDQWFAAVLGYLEKEGVDPQARRQYDFWFGRRRHRSEAGVPKEEAIELYDYLRNWALISHNDSKNATLLVLAEQARRIRDLLRTLPEQRLSFLELERIVRTVYEPAPVQVAEPGCECLSYVHQPGAVAAAAAQVLWWNCIFQDATPQPDRWQAAEREWLGAKGVFPETPRTQSERTRLLGLRPVLQAAEQLVLLVPGQADGVEVVPSLLLGDIHALLPDAASFSFDLDDEKSREALSAIFQVPETEMLPPRLGSLPRPQLLLERPELVPGADYETPTTLESLFYYPHRWFFRQKLRLFPSNLLRLTADVALLGSLAHRFFELLLKEDFTQLDKTALFGWVDAQAQPLLEREGATLLLYGHEPERNAFLNRVKNAAWSLVSLLRANNWEVEGTEIPLEGEIGGIPVRGKADLVLRRGRERAIVDLKWSGSTRRRELLRNEEDLQLVLYAKLLPPPDEWPHTAYFILEDGKMIARTRAAFSDAIVPGPCDDHAEVCARIFAKMERTFSWRLAQVEAGRVELRSARTAADLEEIYADEDLFELLEMKSEDARWDDYRTLLE